MLSRDRLTFVESGTRTVDGDSGTIDFSPTRGNLVAEDAIFMLDVTAVSGTLPELRVFIQRELPNGDFDDVVAFTKVTAITKRNAFWTSRLASNAELAISDGLLGESVMRGGVLAWVYRIKWKISGVAPSFTFSVLGDIYRQD